MLFPIKARRYIELDDTDSIFGSHFTLRGYSSGNIRKNPRENTALLELDEKDTFFMFSENDIRSFYAKKEGLYFTIFTVKDKTNDSEEISNMVFFLINEDDNIERFSKLVSLPLEELQAYILKGSLE